MLLVQFLDVYGDELDDKGHPTCLQWHPETIRMELQDDFNAVLSQPNFDRLMAAIAILTRDGFYTSLPDFIAICNVLSGGVYDPDVFDPADLDEIAWGVTEGVLLNPPDDDNEEPFSLEIRKYIGVMLDREGIMSPPDVLRLAVRDGDDRLGHVQSEFTDDPDMFQAIWEFEQGKTDELSGLIRNGLKTLVEQMQNLQLQTGSTQAFAGQFGSARAGAS